MGREAAEAFAPARERFEAADRVLKNSLSRFCWEGPAETLTRTQHCQPALYVTSSAILAALESLLKERGQPLEPAAAAGLSLGEYTALAAAGAYSFEDGLKLVALRGRAMEEAAQVTPGAMASVMGLAAEALEPVCAETGAQIANLNAPGQVVLSGSAESVEAACALAQERGAKRAVPLNVGGAFHSRLMEPAAERLEAALARTAVQAPRFPVMSNVTGAPHERPETVRTLLAQQLTRPVLWEACVRSMRERGIETFLEVGSGSVLKGLLRKIDPRARVVSVGSAEEVRAAVDEIARGA